MQCKKNLLCSRLKNKIERPLVNCLPGLQRPWVILSALINQAGGAQLQSQRYNPNTSATILHITGT